MPYLRVLLSATVGDTLYPHPSGRRWRRPGAPVPAGRPPDDRRREIEQLERSLPAVADLMASHRSPTLDGHQLGDLMPLDQRRPEQLLTLYRAWQDDLGVLARQAPTLVFAVLGQARATGRLAPDAESQVLADVLTAWAVRGSLDVVERDPLPRPRARGRSAVQF